MKIYVEDGDKNTLCSPSTAVIKKSESSQSYNQEGLLELLSSLHTSTNTLTSTAIHKLLANTSTHTHTHSSGENNSATRRKPVKVEFILAAKAPECWYNRDPVETVKRLARRRKQSKTPVTWQQRTQRPKGTPVKCRTLTHTHIQTHTLHSSHFTDETATARHSVMTHAIIAFPPAVSENAGNSGVHRCGASSQSCCRMEKVSVEAHNDKHKSRMDSHSATSAKPALMKKP